MKYMALALVPLFSQAVYANGNFDESDSDSETENIGQQLTQIRVLIDEMKYQAAVQTLNDIIKTDNRNADVWNLLGYSYRKMVRYKEAGIAYRKALIYKPDHKGALEYQGELFIAINQLDKARANLQQLEALCPTGCEELSDLEAALAQATGAIQID